jgi:hypothetical protein
MKLRILELNYGQVDSNNYASVMAYDPEGYEENDRKVGYTVIKFQLNTENGNKLAKQLSAISDLGNKTFDCDMTMVRRENKPVAVISNAREIESKPIQKVG